MSTYSASAPAYTRRVAWIARFLAELRYRREHRGAVNELQKLSDERLHDIGVERADIAVLVDAEMARMDLKRLGRLGLC